MLTKEFVSRVNADKKKKKKRNHYSSNYTSLDSVVMGELKVS
jgi:hypothetical protein